MSVRYLAVTWTRQKGIYDRVLGVGVVVAVGAFTGGTFAWHPDATLETALIRGIGFAGFLLLNLILSIGPLCRLDRRFLPLLYNRRHLGVTLGVLGLAHAVFAVVQYHSLGNVSPFVSLLSSNRDWTSLADFPFEMFGLLALLILVVMAATSHDYWLSVLTPPVWKRLHMLVYVAYLALIFHVSLGFLQDQPSLVYTGFLGASVLLIGCLHVAAAIKERPGDQAGADSVEWVDVGAANQVPEGRAIVRVVAGERVAVFCNQGRLSAVSNVCKHQNGPLGEGRIIDGCITCPWHGYQYQPTNGTSPPPFHDSVPTFNLAVVAGRVLVDPTPNPPGTEVAPVPIEGPRVADNLPFYVGYQPEAPLQLGHFMQRTAASLLIGTTLIALGLAKAQTGFAKSRFDFGTPSVIEGVVRATPYPSVAVIQPGSTQVRRYLLSAAGKHGAQAAVAGQGGRRVRITGPLAYRDELTLLEIAATTPIDSAVAPGERPVELGTFELAGEVLDSKCYAGAMNPGTGKTHRACAARCLSGGIAPLLEVRGIDGKAQDVILLDSTGNPLPGVDRWAGKRVSLRGRVFRLDNLWFVRIGGMVESAR